MRSLVLTNDPIIVNVVETLLKEAGIGVHILDRHASSLPGAVGMVPQRIVVASADWDSARQILCDAELRAWIVDEG
jgi:hypothetical protein